MNTQAIAEKLLGAIEWEDSITGYCRCPGEARHTQKTDGRHCRVTLDKAPTIFCFHTSCFADIEAVNFTLRSAIARGELAGGTAKRRQPTAAEIEAQKERERLEHLKARAKSSLAAILARFEDEPADFWEASPVRLSEHPANDWRLLLQLFYPQDVVWIGKTTDSCDESKDERRKAECREHFRPVAEWLAMESAPGQFTCPSVFKPGTHSRSNDNVIVKPFLVVESDVLNKPQMCAVISWCQQFMQLRAVVDTAGKSLHGWFNQPSDAAEKELRAILPNLGRTGPEATLDPALFKMAQPCRLPGAVRGDGVQSLIYLDLEGKL